MANRLTKENYEDDALHLKGKTQSQYNNELWQYAKEREDIEEEFGIDSVEDLRDRLTKYKFLANHEMSCVDANAYNLMLEDLNKYRSIEQELGIDIPTYFKIKQAKKVYTKDGLGRIDEKYLRDNFNGILVFSKGFVNIPECDEALYISGYGKDWALTKEELVK